MKKVIMFLMLILMFAIVGYAGIPVNDDFNAAGIRTTTVTAVTWTLVSGSTAQSTDDVGNKINLRAYQIALFDSAYNTLDFYYAYSSAPTTFFPWKTSLWGPLQTKQLATAGGIYVYATITAGSATAYIDRKY